MMLIRLLIVFVNLSYVIGFHFSVNPPNNAFLLHSNTAATNITNRILYLQDDCPYSTDQNLVVSTGSRTESTRLFSSIPNLHCAVTVKLVQDVVKLDRPYVDVLAIGDLPTLSFLKQSACVTVQVTSPRADMVTSSCHLSPFDESKQSCLIRVQIPYSWFGAVGKNSTKQTLSLSHTVSSTCNIPFYDRPQTSITILPYIENAQAHTLAKRDDVDLSLLSRSNISLSLRSLNSLFVHLTYNSTKNTLDSLEIRLFLDARLELLSVSPLSPDDWTVRVVSAQRPEVYTAFVCTPKNRTNSYDGYIFSLLLKMKGTLVENKRLERGEEGSEAALHWEIRRQTEGRNDSKDQIDRVATKFRITPDVVYAMVPVAKNTDIVNTGILSGKQSATTMRVHTVTLGGKISDVTALSHCISQEAKVLKTSPTCTTVYVDGSEMRGMSKVDIHVHFEQWTTSIPFVVWYPRLPITLLLRDPVLNAISNWPVATWKELKEGKEGRHKKRAARQFACSNRYQQTELTVLASFQVSDERTGERMFLSGSRDLLFDVTSLSADSILSADRSIAAVKTINNRVLVQAVSPGNTRILLMFQHGSFFYQLHYSDDTSEPLDDVTGTDFVLASSSTDERVIAISHKAANAVDMIALDDLADPSVELDLRAPAHCHDSESVPLASALVPLHVQFSEMDSSRLAVARVLAGGNATSLSPPPPQDSSLRMDTILAILLVIILLIGAGRICFGRAKHFRGYEKLVAPLLSRLSSSSSGGGRDEDTKEWVWLSRARVDSNSIGSRYSQKSTMQVPEPQSSSPSYDENTHTSISYRGSEISVFISPTPVITVHADRPTGGSWRSSGRSRTRAARHALVDSSSDHNLARVVQRSGSWRDEPSAAWPHHTWNAKRRPPTANKYDGAIRESVA